MATEAIVNQIVQSLAFEVEAVPQPQNDTAELASASNSTPLNVRIRVKKKNDHGMEHAIMLVPKFGHPDAVPERIRLVSSDQTIMSFDVSMEADFAKKNKRKKSRKSFFGGCLGLQYDDDQSTYLPSNFNGTKTDDNASSKSDGVIKQNIILSKTKYVGSKTQSYKRKPDILGKCKPGGCLDPPFGEERYAYEPIQKLNLHSKVTSVNEEVSPTSAIIRLSKRSDMAQANFESGRNKNDITLKSVQAEDSSIFSLYEANMNSSVDSKYSDSVITYPSDITSLSTTNNEKKLKTNVNIEKKQRTSYNDSINAFYTSPRRSTSPKNGKSETDKNLYQTKTLPRNAEDILSNQKSKITKNTENEYDFEFKDTSMVDGNLLDTQKDFGEIYNSLMNSPTKRTKNDDFEGIDKYESNTTPAQVAPFLKSQPVDTNANEAAYTPTEPQNLGTLINKVDMIENQNSDTKKGKNTNINSNQMSYDSLKNISRESINRSITSKRSDLTQIKEQQFEKPIIISDDKYVDVIPGQDSFHFASKDPSVDQVTQNTVVENETSSILSNNLRIKDNSLTKGYSSTSPFDTQPCDASDQLCDKYNISFVSHQQPYENNFQNKTTSVTTNNSLISSNYNIENKITPNIILKEDTIDFMPDQQPEENKIQNEVPSISLFGNNQNEVTSISSSIKNQNEIISSYPSSINRNNFISLSKSNLQRNTSVHSDNSNRNEIISVPTYSNQKEIMTSSSSKSTRREFVSVLSSNSNQKKITSVTSSDNNQKEIASIPSSHSNKKEIASIPSSNSNRKEISSTPSSNSNRKEIASIPSSHSNRKEIASMPSSNSNRKEIASIPSSNSNRKEIASTPSSNSNRKEIASIPSSHSNRKEIASIPSSHSNRKEIASIPSSNSNRKEIASVPSSNSNRKEIASTPSSNSNRKEIASIPSSYSNRKEIASTPSPNSNLKEIASIPSSNSNRKEIASTPSSSSNQKEITTTPSSNSNRKETNSISSANDNQISRTSSQIKDGSEEQNNNICNDLDATSDSLQYSYENHEDTEVLSLNTFEKSNDFFDNVLDENNNVKARRFDSILDLNINRGSEHNQDDFLAPIQEDDEHPESDLSLEFKKKALRSDSSKNNYTTLSETVLSKNSNDYPDNCLAKTEPRLTASSVSIIEPLSNTKQSLRAKSNIAVPSATASSISSKLNCQANFDADYRSYDDDKFEKVRGSKSSIKRDTVFLDLGFQSYLNERRERTIKTVNTSKDILRYRDDAITVVKSVIRPLTNEIRIPVDSDNEMTIKLKKTSSPTQHVQIIEARSLDQDGTTIYRLQGTRNEYNENDFASYNDLNGTNQYPHNFLGKMANSEMQRILNTVYEQELVPLRMTIMNLKEEIDKILNQQSILVEELCNVIKAKPVRLLGVNPRCDCWRK